MAEQLQQLQLDFKEPLQVSALAKLSQQSESTFHRHFQELTGLSPLQFQKRLRLQKARRLLITASANVSSAAYTVGYQSVHQFAREYHRLYGKTPSNEMKWSRSEPLSEPSSHKPGKTTESR